jgi:FkbM family methyltransferase
MSLLTSPFVARVTGQLHRYRLRGLNRLAKKLLMRAGVRSLSVSMDGLVLSGPVTSWNTLTQIGSGQYEPTEVELFKQALRVGQTVVDVGANVGLYSLIAARAVGDEGRVFSFEPDPRTVPFLAENATRNHLKNITIVSAAASDVEGTQEMYLAPHANRSSLYRTPTLDGLERVESVETVSVDSVLGDSKVDVVKVDAEGSEPQVFRGMARSLTRDSVVFLEFNPVALQATGVEPADFGTWLFDRFELVQRIEAHGLATIGRPPDAFANLRCSHWRESTTTESTTT